MMPAVYGLCVGSGLITRVCDNALVFMLRRGSKCCCHENLVYFWLALRTLTFWVST